MSMRKLTLILSSFVVIATGCAPMGFQELDQIASSTAGAVGCASFESKTWDAINNYLIEKNEIPAAADLKERLKLALKESKGPRGSLSEEQLDRLTADVLSLYDVFLKEAVAEEKVHSASELLTVLTALELGDHTTTSKITLQAKVESSFEKIQSDVKQFQVQCATPEEPPPPVAAATPVGPEAKTLSLPVFGAKWAMATAYQSCQALNEPVLTRATPDADGIVITGTHEDGIGSLRQIASVSSLLRTHPYYKNVTNYGPSCLSNRSTPLIYDYGGRPYATATAGSTLNLFRDSGYGTRVLGIDCSGYVYTALAAAGLRLSASKQLKASDVYGISSTMFLEPEANKLTCLQKITVTPNQNLKAGDIAAIQGHVVMVDSVGADPFGIRNASSAADCANLSAKNFDFVIIQSSNSKEGIGINRFKASEYLADTNTLRVGFERYAYYSCLAKFNDRNYTPNLGTTSVIRHKLTSECMGTRIALTQESCIQDCAELAR
jgi:hypothetical protein